MNFEQIYIDNKKLIYKNCYFYTKDRVLAEDLMHDIFLKFFTESERFQNKSSVTTYLYTISINFLIDFSKRKRIVYEPIENYDIELSESESKEPLYELIANLPLEDKKLLELKFIEGLGYDKLTTIFNKNKSCLKMKVKRLKQKLRT